MDYDRFGTPETDRPQREPPSLPPELIAWNRALRDEHGDFGPLRYTAAEAGEVAAAYWDVMHTEPQRFLGTHATEARLKRIAEPPRILHLATHGFQRSPERQASDGANERPLTSAGLALAGANLGLQGQSSPDGEDGILYALEAQGLNLEGTELVTLSACDTGRGQVDYSEGIYGLVRALRIAGSRHVLMSLWPVDDALTKEFMVAFYNTWLSETHGDPGDALHRARLKFIRSEDPQQRDPRHWAPFVLVESGPPR